MQRPALLVSFVARGAVSAERGAEAPFGDESFRIRPALRGTDFFCRGLFPGTRYGAKRCFRRFTAKDFRSQGSRPLRNARAIECFFKRHVLLWPEG